MGTYYVSDFRKTAENDDAAIKLCFEAAKSSGERTVVFDGNDYLIENAVLLPRDTTVIIDGCKIKQKDLSFDNVFRGDNVTVNGDDPYGLPLGIVPTENIRIIGKNEAVIEGPDENPVMCHPYFGENQTMVGDFFGWRTLQISLSMCDNFEISGIRFEKTRCWALSFDMCTNGHVHDLSIYSSVKNGDGVDIRSGCHGITVENIVGNCFDDTVACTALSAEQKQKYEMKNGRYIYTMEPTRCLLREFGDKTDISDIVIRNVKTGGLQHGIICLAANGCKIRDVVIEDIEEVPTSFENPAREATVKIYTGYGTSANCGDISNITVKNVKGLYAVNTVYSNAQVKNVVLENISHPLDKRVLLDHPDGFVIR